MKPAVISPSIVLIFSLLETAKLIAPFTTYVRPKVRPRRNPRIRIPDIPERF